MLSCFSRVQPHGQQPSRLLWPRDSLGKNTGVGCHFFLQVPPGECLYWINQLISDFNNHTCIWWPPGPSPESQNCQSGCLLDCTCPRWTPTPTLFFVPRVASLMPCTRSLAAIWDTSTYTALNSQPHSQTWCSSQSTCSPSISAICQLGPQLSSSPLQTPNPSTQLKPKWPCLNTNIAIFLLCEKL